MKGRNAKRQTVHKHVQKGGHTHVLRDICRWAVKAEKMGFSLPLVSSGKAGVHMSRSWRCASKSVTTLLPRPRKETEGSYISSLQALYFACTIQITDELLPGAQQQHMHQPGTLPNCICLVNLSVMDCDRYSYNIQCTDTVASVGCCCCSRLLWSVSCCATRRCQKHTAQHMPARIAVKAAMMVLYTPMPMAGFARGLICIKAAGQKLVPCTNTAAHNIISNSTVN